MLLSFPIMENWSQMTQEMRFLRMAWITFGFILSKGVMPGKCMKVTRSRRICPASRMASLSVFEVIPFSIFHWGTSEKQETSLALANSAGISWLTQSTRSPWKAVALEQVIPQIDLPIFRRATTKVTAPTGIL